MSNNNLLNAICIAFLACFILVGCQKNTDLLLTDVKKDAPATSRHATDCYTIIFPIVLLFPDGGRTRIYDLTELEEFLEEWDDWYEGAGTPRLKFPVKVKLAGGKKKRIRSQKEWDDLEATCADNTEEETTNEDNNDNSDTNDTDTDTNETDNSNDNADNNNIDTSTETNEIGSTTAPSATWFKEQSGSKEESHGHYIMTCLDGGYLQIGETGYVPNSAKILVVKTDSQGNLLWKTELGSTGHNLGNSALEVADGYLIAGALNQNSALFKLNKNTGSILFQKTYNLGGSDAFEHLALTTNGIAAVGYLHAADGNNTFFTEGQGILVFLDGRGNKLNQKNINSYMAHAYRIKRSQNSLIIAGLTAEALDYTVLKTDLSGNVQWHKTYGGSNQDHCFGLDLGADGSIFLTGHTLSGTQNWDTYTMKLNATGQLLWQQKKGNPRGFDPRYVHDEAWGIKATPDGGCIVVAGTGDEYAYSACNAAACSDNWAVYLVKYDAAGNLQWQKTYANQGARDWAGEDIDLTPDGGAIVSVDNGQFGFLKIALF